MIGTFLSIKLAFGSSFFFFDFCEIGPASKACVNGLTQVISAAKTLASTLDNKLQHPLLQCSKDLAVKMSQLFAAVRYAILPEACSASRTYRITGPN